MSLRYTGFDRIEKLAKFLHPMVGIALTDHTAGRDIQGCEQRSRAVPVTLLQALKNQASGKGRPYPDQCGHSNRARKSEDVKHSGMEFCSKVAKSNIIFREILPYLLVKFTIELAGVRLGGHYCQ